MVRRSRRRRTLFVSLFLSEIITCVYGIRVLSMLGLILAHTYIFVLPHLTNLGDLIADSVPVRLRSNNR